ncbi:chromosome segregation ATPase [Actinomadura madurae]|uniref:Chromosome segregation ATPase n=2 Tax=Thermomonosporaceae TaxID=2012 RepID=A0A1I5WWB1_9ACTN|nr:chromosome segregation ATPase [Actinomadura madurae]SPT60686.1 Sporulation initiation inhibitor protein soj [Actinomadura madurae]
MSTGPGLGRPDRADESPDEQPSGLGGPGEAEGAQPPATGEPQGDPGTPAGTMPSGHAMWGNTTSGTAENVGYVPTNTGAKPPPSPRKGPDQGESELVREALRDAKVSHETTVTALKAMSGRREREWPRPDKCRIITIANQKGGVGKTTSSVNLAASLAMHGAQVLVVDLDPQGNASTALGVEHHAEVPSIYDVLIEDMALGDIVVPAPEIPNLYCAPATLNLAGAEIELVSKVARESRLRRAIDAYDTEKFDYVLIDCPPSLGLLTVNALVGGDELLIPIQCEYYALEGLGQLIRTVDLVKAHLNQRLRVSTILLTMYDARTRLAAQVADDVRNHFGDVVLNTVIPRSVRVSEAPSYGQSVMTYDPGSSGALAYSEAASEMAHGGAVQ